MKNNVLTYFSSSPIHCDCRANSIEGVSKHLDFSSTTDFADFTDLQIADYQQ